MDGGLEIGSWHLTGFYGDPNTANRPKSWAKLQHFHGTSNPPWLVSGDFNEIMGLSEKEGGSFWPRPQMERFAKCVNGCGLKDIGFVGPKFTWIYQRANGF